MSSGMTDAPGPSMYLVPFGHDGQSKIQTSATIRDLIAGIDVSSAVSRIASVGVTVLGFKFALTLYREKYIRCLSHCSATCTPSRNPYSQAFL